MNRYVKELDKSIKDLAVLPGTSQLYILSHARKAWHMFTHCARCPDNSVSPAGIVEQGISRACRCASDFYGTIVRPVVDTCTQCINTGTNASGGSLLRNSCPVGMYKTNIRCTGGTPIDTTCAMCLSACTSGSGMPLSTPGQYITSTCDGTGTSREIGCADCSQACPNDDYYMDPEVFCTGTSRYDTRPAEACRRCRPDGCGQGKYITGRCLRLSRPTTDTTNCADCSACQSNQYIARACNGSTYFDMKECMACSLTSSSCPEGTRLINECLSGLDQQDTTQCTSCNNNCNPADFSRGYAGEFIRFFCSAGTNNDNVCQNCLSSCGSGSYVSAACTGLNQIDTQCRACRQRCLDDEYIQGSCSGVTLNDTSKCVRCTAKPGNKYFTLNKCDGTTRLDQVCLLFYCLTQYKLYHLDA